MIATEAMVDSDGDKDGHKEEDLREINYSNNQLIIEEEGVLQIVSQYPQSSLGPSH